MEPLDVCELGGDTQRLFGGYMKMQWISVGPKRAAAAMLLALGLGAFAVAGADPLLNPPPVRFAATPCAGAPLRVLARLFPESPGLYPAASGRAHLSSGDPECAR